MEASSFQNILARVLPIILLFILGFIFNKRKYLEHKTIEDLKKLIVNIGLPSMLFLSFSETNFNANHIVIILTMFLLCIFFLLAGYLLSALIKDKSPYFPMLMTGFEAGMLGYSIFTIIFGAENVFKFAIIDIGQVVFVFFILVGLLIKQRQGSSSFSETLLTFIKTPVIAAIFLGILAQKTGFTNFLESSPILYSIHETLKLISTIIMPLICVIIGFEIRFETQSFIGALRVVLLRFIILITAAIAVNNFIIIKLLNLDKTFQAAVVLMFMLPPPFVIPLYIRDEDIENKRFVFNTLSLNTILSILGMLIVSAVYIN